MLGETFNSMTDKIERSVLIAFEIFVIKLKISLRFSAVAFGGFPVSRTSSQSLSASHVIPEGYIYMLRHRNDFAGKIIIDTGIKGW